MGEESELEVMAVKGTYLAEKLRDGGGSGEESGKLGAGDRV